MKNNTLFQEKTPILLVLAENIMHFGVNLRRWRKAKGLTQEELAKAVGINVSYVSNLERNFSANKKGVPQPSRELCKKFAKVLAVNETDVMLAAGFSSENFPKLPEFLYQIDWTLIKPEDYIEIQHFVGYLIFRSQKVKVIETETGELFGFQTNGVKKSA